MEIFEFDLDKCDSCKRLLNRKQVARTIYKNEFAPSNKIGNCAKLYNILEPSDCYDFYAKELEYAEKNHHLDIRDRGLTYEEFYNLSEQYKKRFEEETCIRYDLSVYFYSLVCHAIVETYFGQKKERELINYIKGLGYDCSKVESRKDTRYGLDLKVHTDEEDFYIQVKPISFFLASAKDTEQDRDKCCEKRQEILDSEGLETYYAIYDTNQKQNKTRWYLNKHGKILFKNEDLFGEKKDRVVLKDSLKETITLRN